MGKKIGKGKGKSKRKHSALQNAPQGDQAHGRETRAGMVSLYKGYDEWKASIIEYIDAKNEQYRGMASPGDEWPSPNQKLRTIPGSPDVGTPINSWLQSEVAALKEYERRRRAAAAAPAAAAAAARGAKIMMLDTMLRLILKMKGFDTRIQKLNVLKKQLTCDPEERIERGSSCRMNIALAIKEFCSADVAKNCNVVAEMKERSSHGEGNLTRWVEGCCDATGVKVTPVKIATAIMKKDRPEGMRTAQYPTGSGRYEMVAPRTEEQRHIITMLSKENSLRGTGLSKWVNEAMAEYQKTPAGAAVISKFGKQTKTAIAAAQSYMLSQLVTSNNYSGIFKIKCAECWICGKDIYLYFLHLFIEGKHTVFNINKCGQDEHVVAPGPGIFYALLAGPFPKFLSGFTGVWGGGGKKGRFEAAVNGCERIARGGLFAHSRCNQSKSDSLWILPPGDVDNPVSGVGKVQGLFRPCVKGIKKSVEAILENWETTSDLDLIFAPPAAGGNKPTAKTLYASILKYLTGFNEGDHANVAQVAMLQGEDYVAGQKEIDKLYNAMSRVTLPMPIKNPSILYALNGDISTYGDTERKERKVIYNCQLLFIIYILVKQWCVNAEVGGVGTPSNGGARKPQRGQRKQRQSQQQQPNPSPRLLTSRGDFATPKQNNPNKRALQRQKWRKAKAASAAIKQSNEDVNEELMHILSATPASSSVALVVNDPAVFEMEGLRGKVRSQGSGSTALHEMADSHLKDFVIEQLEKNGANPSAQNSAPLDVASCKDEADRERRDAGSTYIETKHDKQNVCLVDENNVQYDLPFVLDLDLFQSTLEIPVGDEYGEEHVINLQRMSDEQRALLPIAPHPPRQGSKPAEPWQHNPPPQKPNPALFGTGERNRTRSSGTAHSAPNGDAPEQFRQVRASAFGPFQMPQPSLAAAPAATAAQTGSIQERLAAAAAPALAPAATAAQTGSIQERLAAAAAAFAAMPPEQQAQHMGQLLPVVPGASPPQASVLGWEGGGNRKTMRNINKKLKTTFRKKRTNKKRKQETRRKKNKRSIKKILTSKKKTRKKRKQETRRKKNKRSIKKY